LSIGLLRRLITNCNTGADLFTKCIYSALRKLRSP
jgi:hypothetical protein